MTDQAELNELDDARSQAAATAVDAVPPNPTANPDLAVTSDEEPAEETAAPNRSALTDEQLFQQSEIAADYIEGLLDVLDADGDIDELVSGGRPIVEVVGTDLQSLVGPKGATLEALQELARLAVYRQIGEPSRLLLDVGGYREQRRAELAKIAQDAVEKVRQHGDTIKLPAMSAFERKCVHDVVNASEGVESESEGVEPQRRIVVRAVGGSAVATAPAAASAEVQPD